MATDNWNYEDVTDEELKHVCKRCNEPMDQSYGKICEGCQEWIAEARLEMDD